MVPSQSTLCDSGNDKKSPDKTVPLSLVPIDHKPPAHNECQEFTLKSDPTNTNSANYKFHICYLKGTEDVHAILAWQDDINHFIARLGVNQPTSNVYALHSVYVGHH
jgi:hypothetical protein